MGFTNASSNTFPPTTLQPLYRIWRDWCIGDSLGYMNDNFLYLDTKIDALSTVPYARLNDGNQTGSAPIFGCRAWVNFNGLSATGTYQTIRNQGNVSSVYKNAAGDYTIAFTVPMPTTSYCVFGSGIEDAGGDEARTSAISLYSVATMSTSSVRVQNANIGSITNTDGAVITVSVIC